MAQALPVNRMDRQWMTEVAAIGEGVARPQVPYERIEAAANLKPYSLRNGAPSEVEPYLLTSAIAAQYHWVPINGLAPTSALKCIDGFVRSHYYRLFPAENTDANRAVARKAAIILGVARAVMVTNYELTRDDINARELADPVLSVTFNEEGIPAYTSLVASTAANANVLAQPMNFTAEELKVIQVIIKCGQAIIPVQGLNIITDGHHYLSDKGKQSFKAFLAVERQVWIPQEFKDWINGVEVAVRDLMWHKAGHPVAVSLKENAATDPLVKERLERAKLGSAAARLPALDPELRAADTYLKLAESVSAMWSTLGGSVNADVIRLQVGLVKMIPRSVTDLAPPIDMGDGLMANTRAMAISILKETVAKNTDIAALLFGFYCAMLDGGGGDTNLAGTDTLRIANSLKKLRDQNTATFMNGADLYRDYRAFKSANRKVAEKKMPAVAYE